MEEQPVYTVKDVVVVEIPFSEKKGSKPRPVILLEDQSPKFAVCCCTTTDRTGSIAGKLIEKDSAENEVFFNFEHDTFISYSDIFVIYKEDIMFHIGFCDQKTFDEVMPHFEKSSFKASQNE